MKPSHTQKPRRTHRTKPIQINMTLIRQNELQTTPVFQKAPQSGPRYHLHDNVQITLSLQHFNQRHDVSMAHAHKHFRFLPELSLALPPLDTGCPGDGFNGNLMMTKESLITLKEKTRLKVAHDSSFTNFTENDPVLQQFNETY